MATCDDDDAAGASVAAAATVPWRRDEWLRRLEAVLPRPRRKLLQVARSVCAHLAAGRGGVVDGGGGGAAVNEVGPVGRSFARARGGGCVLVRDDGVILRRAARRLSRDAVRPQVDPRRIRKTSTTWAKLAKCVV